MAKYRQIHTSFWEDGFVLDLTPEEKYFYIYLMTNSKTSQCGVYELPKRIIETETGYNRETVQKLLQRFVDYMKIDYHEGTKEIMILNWIKYNPPNNHNAQKCVNGELKQIKNKDFLDKFIRLANDYCRKNGVQTDVLFEGIEIKAPYKPLRENSEPLPSNKIINNKEEVINNKQEVKSAAVEIINYLNSKTEKNFSTETQATIKLINGRLSEGRTVEDFKKVIDKKCAEWLGKKNREGKPMDDYLRPSTLFAPTNFENYLNECSQGVKASGEYRGDNDPLYTKQKF